jgi:hypothetical protein
MKRVEYLAMYFNDPILGPTDPYVLKHGKLERWKVCDRYPNMSRASIATLNHGNPPDHLSPKP